MGRFSQEILDLIIDEVAKLDIEPEIRLRALSACALANYSLTDRAQSHIYKCAKIDEGSYERQTGVFLTNRSLGRHVKELHIYNIHLLCSRSSLPAVLATFRNVTSLKISSWDEIDVCADPGCEFSSDLQQAFRDILHLSSMKKINITDMRNIPSPLIRPILPVREVKLLYSSFSAPKEGSPQEPPTPNDTFHNGDKVKTSLELSIRDAESLQPLSQAFPASNLKLEKFRPSYERLIHRESPPPEITQSVMRIISSQKDTLTTLEFPDYGCFDIDLNEVPRLQNLLFDFDMDCDLGYPFAFMNIAKLLSTARIGNSIHNIMFTLSSYCFSSEPPLAIRRQFHRGWELMDHVISKPQFAEVRNVTIRIGGGKTVGGGKEFGKSFPERFAGLFPRLKEKEILCIDCFTGFK